MRYLFAGLLALLISIPAVAQQTAVDYENPKEYVIGSIQVEGTKYLDKDILILLSGLRPGSRVMVPGSDVTKCVQALWKQGLFADVSIEARSITNDTIHLVYQLTEKPRLSAFTFKGIRKGEQSDIREKINLTKGKVLTDNILVNTKNAISNYYTDKGFVHASVELKTVKDTTFPNSVLLYIVINKGNRVKIDDIIVSGNREIKSRKLYGQMKKTKRNTWYSIFNISRFIQKDFDNDKRSVEDYYNKKGFRDATITHDSLATNPKGNYVLYLTIDEGNKYYFRTITWKGNTKYSSGRLDTILNINSGDVFNQQRFDRRLKADPNGNDVSSLYLDDGYLFFNATPVEVNIDNDSIDIEIRIYEGPQAIINEVNISGNDKTSEHVVPRALHTLPGNKFSRADIIRSQRELATLGFFDPEKTQIIPVPHPENGTVDINYIVEEKPSDQLELSAGYGGQVFGVTGSLGVRFNNFSTRNMFRKGGWSPIPVGDGQQVGIRAQSNGRLFQSYNISFTEPWLGGKKPNSLSVGGNRTRIATTWDKENPNYGYLITTGASIGYGRQLKWPDDYFTLVSSIDYQNYDLKNYASRNFIISDGTANSLSIKETFSRNSLSDFTFPKSGSNITLTVQITPPWSLFSGKDYTDLPNNQKYKWIEYHKYRFTSDWYTNVFGKFVLRTATKMGYLGNYNSEIGPSPFERFVLGGDGLSNLNFNLAGQEIIAQRGGYDPYAPPGGATIFNKHIVELRYPFSTNPSAFIYGHIFAEAANQWLRVRDFNPFKLNRSVGAGMRFLLPAFGLLGFDYGIPFDLHQVFPGTPKATTLRELFSRGKITIVLGFEPE